MRIGIPYEIYRPIVAIEVAAAKATDDPREGRAKQKDRNAASQTVLMGERNLSSTLWKKCGYHVQISTGYGSEKREDLQFHHLSRKQTSSSSSKSWRTTHNATHKS
jgi:hypothetical protein